MADTIFALSSGAPPAGIGVIRISGPVAGQALQALAGILPVPRQARLATLHNQNGDTLDQALVLWLPGPGTATGEDVAEIHCHGGRAVIAAIESALANLPGLRLAEPGEFTRRGFANGRMDLAEAEGLADLLVAETELQRQTAVAMAGGALSRLVSKWRDRLLGLSAAVEAALDFADEDDVAGLPPTFTADLDGFQAELAAHLVRPRAEVLREGFRVVLAGPPNSGKSSLFNALIESDAAIITSLAGTTRDVLTRSVAIAGIPFLFADTAGLRDDTADVVEAIGIERARNAAARADMVLWLGDEHAGPPGAWEIEAQVDRAGHPVKRQPQHRVSAVTGEGIDHLRLALAACARQALPKPGEVALNQRQHQLLAVAQAALAESQSHDNPLLIAEGLRQARRAFDALLGNTGTEDMLDALFGRFCIGK